jgi:autotransporter-associated beta strand protein
MGGATLNYTRTGGTTQAITTTNITAGANTITAVTGNTLTLGSLVKTGAATVNFGTTGTITTSTANDASGILGGWATFGGTNWAVANGAGSAITGFAGPYDLTSVALNVAANYASKNISVDSNQSPAAVITPNTLTFNTAGAYTLTLTGNTNTFPGIMVNSAVGNNASLITGGTGLRGTSGGSLNITQNNTSGANSALTIGTIILNNGTATGLNKSGAGTLILTAANTYTGITTINAGTLQIGNGGATGTLASTSTILNNSSLVINQGTTQTLAAISGTGSVTVNASTGLTLNAGNNFSGGFTLNSGTISSIAAGTFNGFGTGTVTINGGTLNAVTGSPAITINNNMAWNSVVTLSRASSGTPVYTFNGDIVLGANSGYANGAATYSHTVIFNGDISETGGARSFTASIGSVAGNNITFNGQNTFTGAITVPGSTYPVKVGGSGYLGGGNYAGAITLAGASFTYSSSANQTLGGIIGGSGTTLTKDTSTTSTLTLSGGNSYTGATAVNAGTLAITGTGSINNTSSITVAAGATLRYNSSTALTKAPTLNGSGVSNRAVLAGTGPINVAVTLDNVGDTLSPGNSPGIESFTVGQSWAAFSYDWEVNDFSDVTGLTAGSDFDQIGITGGLTLTGAAANSYYLNILSLTAGNVTGDAANFSEINRSWNILTTTTGITGFNASYWNLNTTGFTNVEGGTWSLAQSGNNLVLSYTAVPEPRAALLGGLGMLMLLRRRR